MAAQQPLVVIYGPTASGKTGLAIDVARQCRGEIISADSRAIYQGMDIGAAKPTIAERQGVPHWGFDLVEPGQRFTVADFQQYALAKIDEIRARGNVPFIVGGTGLYIDSVVFNYHLPDDKNTTEIRQKFENEDRHNISKYCIENNMQLPENIKNKRYLINAIIRSGAKQQRQMMPRSDAVLIGVSTDRDILRSRIEKRGKIIFEAGGLSEAKHLADRYGWDSEAMTGNIYRLARQFYAGDMTYDAAIEKFITLDWRLAKRQLTWLKRNNFIQWLSRDEAEEYLLALLNTPDVL